MLPSQTFVRKHILGLLPLVASLCLCLPQASLAGGTIFTFYWEYIVLDNNFETQRKGNLRAELLETITDPQLRKVVAITELHRVFRSEDPNRLYLLVGQMQGDEYFGLLVVQFKPLKVLHFIDQRAAMQYGAGLMEIGDKFYLTWWESALGAKSGPEREARRVTHAYDRRSFNLTHAYRDTLLGIGHVACLLDGKFYNGTLFSLPAGEEIQWPGIPLRLRVYDCFDGRVLAILTTTIEVSAKMLVARPTPEKLLKTEVATNEFIGGFNTAAWFLSKDVKEIIRDDFPYYGSGVHETRLVFIDINSGAKKVVKLDRGDSSGSGRIEFSPRRDLLFYKSYKDLYIISTEKHEILKKISVPYTMANVIWH